MAAPEHTPGVWVSSTFRRYFSRPRRPAQPEYNVVTDIPSGQQVFHEWQLPVVFSGFEAGLALLFPARSIEHDFTWVRDHPVADAYRAYMHMPYDWPSWDFTAALYAVRPDSGYFSLPPRGTVRVDEKGHTAFTASAEGKHRCLILNEAQKARTVERSFSGESAALALSGSMAGKNLAYRGARNGS